MASVLTEEPRTSLKGRRLPGKPSRFDPDQPLHMTTRRAAKSRTTDGSNSSFTGSIDGESSRRGSLDGLRPSSSNSVESHPSIQAQNFSSSNVTASHENPDLARTKISKSRSTTETTPTSLLPDSVPSISVDSKKRKRSKSPHSIGGAKKTRTSAMASKILDTADVYASESQPVLDPNTSFISEAAQSVETHSASKVNGRLNVNTPSIDATPVVSVAASPASAGSGFDSTLATQPMPDTIDSALSPNDADNLDGVDDQDMLNDIDDQQMSDEDGATAKKRRLGGRRRAVHPIARVEAAMRRQSELRTSYRNLARLQKGLLTEISNRTIEDLRSDADAHTQVPRYHLLVESLQSRLSQRRAKVQRDHDLIKSLLEKELRIEQHVQRVRHSQYVSEMQEVYLNRLEHSLLKLERQAQLPQDAGDHATEDEDDVVPRLKRARYRSRREGPLAAEYDSRSRLLLETDRMVHKLNARLEMKKALQMFDADGEDYRITEFTVMDFTSRKAAEVRRLVKQDLSTLTQAVQHVETLANLPPIANEEAFGLQLLSDAAIQPHYERSTRKSRKQVVTPKRPAASTQHKQYAASVQPSVQSLLSSDEPVPSPSIPTVKREESLPFPSPRLMQHTQPLPMPLTAHKSLLNPASQTYAAPATEPAPFQPLRLPGYPHRQFELAPPGEENSRERKPHYTPPWPELPRVPSIVPDLPFSRLHDSGMSPRFPFSSLPPHSGSAGFRTDLSGADRGMEDAHMSPRDVPLPRPFVRDLVEPPRLNDERSFPLNQNPAPGDRVADLLRSPPFAQPPTIDFVGSQQVSSLASESSTTAQDKRSYFNKWKASRDDGGARARKLPREEKRDAPKRHGHSLSTSGLASTAKHSPAPFSDSNLPKPPRRPSWDSAAMLATLTPSLAAHPNASVYPPPPNYNMTNALPPPPPFFAFRPISYEHASPLHHRNSIPQPPQSGWSTPLPVSESAKVLHHPGPEPGANPWPMHPPYQHEPPNPNTQPSLPPPNAPPTTTLGHSYGGPTLAPAYDDPRRRPQGFGGPLPAFAQQQRNSEGTRRRAQSEAQQPKIHQWTPAGSKRI